MESSTLFLSNTINLELHGIFAHPIYMYTYRAIFAFFITFTQLTIEFIALLNDKILCSVIIIIAMLFLC